MVSGGPRVRPGPAPDPNALRRDRDQKDWTTLPRAREGAVPPWPLTRPTRRELHHWTELWTMPQAVIWEHNRQHTEIALYARSLTAAEAPDASGEMRNLVKQQMEILGLTLKGLLRERWRIEGEPVAAQAPTARTDDPARKSAKARFQALEGGRTA